MEMGSLAEYQRGHAVHPGGKTSRRKHQEHVRARRRLVASARACSVGSAICGDAVPGPVCEHGCRQAGAQSVSPPPAPRAHPGRCRCSQAAGSPPGPADRRGWHRLAGQRECPWDDDELTGGLADGEGASVCRFQDSQDVSHLLAAAPCRTAPAEHDALSHVGGGQPHLKPVTHRCYQPASELRRSGRRRSQQVLLVPRGPARWPACRPGPRSLDEGPRTFETWPPAMRASPHPRPALAEFLDAPAGEVLPHRYPQILTTACAADCGQGYGGQPARRCVRAKFT